MNEAKQPIRVQRRRTKGWKMPPNTVSVCRPHKYGNPFFIGDGLHVTRQQCVDSFEKWMLTGESLTHDKTPPDISELQGKNLACFCSLDALCHADVLLRLANASTHT